jgi:hypothetical protein
VRERSSHETSLNPEKIAQLLAVVDTAHVARFMTAADSPAQIEQLALVVDGFGVRDNEYVPYGSTVDVMVHASNCAEIRVWVPEAEASVRLRPQHRDGASSLDHQVFSTTFVAKSAGRVVAVAHNGSGQAAATPGQLDIRVLPPPEMASIGFGDIHLDQIDSDALSRLAETWTRHRGYALDLDVSEFSRDQRMISDEARRMLEAQAGADQHRTSRLHEILAAYPIPRHRAMSAAGMAPGHPHSALPEARRRWLRKLQRLWTL